MEAAASKRVSFGILLFAEIAAMSTWFATNASISAIKTGSHLSVAHEAMLTNSVQAGFVAGTLISALLALPDRIDLTRLFAISSLIASAATFSIVFLDPASTLILLLRFITGFCMAGVYPVGMAIASTWAAGDLGLLIGLLVAGLTIGSAAPHIAAAYPFLDWRTPCAAAGFGALLAAISICFVKLGPNVWTAPKFKVSNVLQAWRNRAVRTANLGYFGHMWELYAMWAWIGSFVSASFNAASASYSPAINPSLVTFAIIASGALGAFGGGWLADRWGRTAVTSLSMIVSGCCALLIGATFGGPPALTIAIGLVWGISVIADSAQFSAAVAELSDNSLRGTMLTIQTSVGFLITLVSIQAMPYVVKWVGWSEAFSLLAIGPFLGTIAMLRLRKMPESEKLAMGRR
jgi:MFS family permease